MAIIGVDVGTSGCKVCAYDIYGTTLCASSRTYQEIRGNGIREIEPVIVRKNVFAALSETAANCPEPIQAIAITCLGESFVCLDEKDNVLCNSMVTGDNRGEEGVQQIQQELGEEYVFHTTGLMPSQLYSLPKLIHLQKHTNSLDKAHHIFFYEDYIGYLLTGERKVSFSSAARSMALDIHHMAWDKTLLATAGLTPEYFSDPVPSGVIIGHVTADAAAKLHLSKGIPVVAGGHDQACASLGSGFSDNSFVQDGIGTCEFLSFMLPKTYNENVLKELHMPCMPYLIPNSFFTALELTTCGALMNWSRDTMFKSTYQNCKQNSIDFFQYMDEQATGKLTDILLLPQFGSCGQPDFSYGTVGTITGFSLETQEVDLYIGLKESMLFQLKLAHDKVTSHGLDLPLKKIVMTGGAAKSALSAQLRANIFQKPIYNLANNEAGTLGCMILCAVAIGIYPDLSSCAKKVVHYTKEFLPARENSTYYERKYEAFKQLYDKMHA